MKTNKIIERKSIRDATVIDKVFNLHLTLNDLNISTKKNKKN